MTIIFILNPDIDIIQLKQYLGPSNELVKSLHRSNHHNSVNKDLPISRLLEETRFLASCTYETGTQWGKQASIDIHKYNYYHILV